MFTLKRVGVLSVGRILGCIYGFMGLVVGAFFSLGYIGGAFRHHDPSPFLFFGVLSIIGLPILYALGGFISGIISAALYNLCVSFVGGIEIELRQEPIARV